jgi:hypothetical protein
MLTDDDPTLLYHPTVSDGPAENLSLKIKNTKRIALRLPQLRPLPAPTVAQPRPHPRRSLTDANQNPRSQVRCVEPVQCSLICQLGEARRRPTASITIEVRLLEEIVSCPWLAKRRSREAVRERVGA